MKQLLWLLTLVISAGQAAFAQAPPASGNTNTERTFEMPGKSVLTRIQVDLGKGNKMQLETCYYEDVEYARNIDSIVRVFMHDMEAFKDSLSDELSSRRIDYRIVSPEIRQIRIVRHSGVGNSFLLSKGEVSALKLEQDSIFLILADEKPRHRGFNDVIVWKHYCRVSFFLNRLEDLPEVLAATKLNEKIATFKQNHYNWYREDTLWRLRSDKSIIAAHANGNTGVYHGDELGFLVDVTLQNYKSYFSPGFMTGIKLTLNDAFTAVNRSPRTCVINVGWAPQFVFQNVQGKLQTSRNDFINASVSYGQLGAQPGNNFRLFTVTFGWLAYRQGDYFEKNTFRFGVSRMSLSKNKIWIEPGMYFNNFFRGVTPMIRVVL